MEASAMQETALALSNAPYEQKWNLLKPTIERMYVYEGKRLRDIVTAIKDQYGFSAV